MLLRVVRQSQAEGGLAFVGVLEHYQQTICVLHALERGAVHKSNFRGSFYAIDATPARRRRGAVLGLTR